MGILAIVLAAGASRRLGRPKQLLVFEGETLLERAIRMVRETGGPLLVVLGAQAETIANSVDLCNVVTVMNTRWEEGMASSIRAGLKVLASCAPHAEGVLISGCDQPRLTSAHIRNLIRRFQASRGLSIAASTYAGTRGIPAIFPRTLFPSLLALEGDKGARGILADAGNAVVEVPFPGGEIDLDLPGDLDRLV